MLSLLPVALESDSIEEFLSKEDVTQEHLWDLCLKLERPRLQDVRDACADFVRGKDGDSQDTAAERDAEEEDRPHYKKVPDKYALPFRHKKRIPEQY
jgi:hypothetical protein